MNKKSLHSCQIKIFCFSTGSRATSILLIKNKADNRKCISWLYITMLWISGGQQQQLSTACWRILHQPWIPWATLPLPLPCSIQAILRGMAWWTSDLYEPTSSYRSSGHRAIFAEPFASPPPNLPFLSFHHINVSEPVWASQGSLWAPCWLQDLPCSTMSHGL